MRATAILRGAAAALIVAFGALPSASANHRGGQARATTARRRWRMAAIVMARACTPRCTAACIIATAMGIAITGITAIADMAATTGTTAISPAGQPSSREPTTDRSTVSTAITGTAISRARACTGRASTGITATAIARATAPCPPSPARPITPTGHGVSHGYHRVGYGYPAYPIGSYGTIAGGSLYAPLYNRPACTCY